MSKPLQQLIKRCTTFRSLFIGIGVIWIVSFIVGAFAPTTVLSDNWVLQNYVSAMSFIANPRGLVTTRASYPEVTALFHSITCWSLPLWFLVAWKWMNGQLGVNKTDMLFKVHLSIGNRLTLLILLPLWFFVIFIGVVLNHGGDTRLISFGTSRTQLAVFGMSWQCLVASSLAVAFFSLKRLFTSDRTRLR